MTYFRNGFTLMELMLVMALVMILSVIGVGAYTQATLKSRDTLRKSELGQIVKGLEAFNQDVGRYPLSGGDKNSADYGVIYCYIKNNGVVTTPKAVCQGNKLNTLIDGDITNYITIPSDPVSNRRYIYESDGSTFSLFTSLENSQDNDLLIGGDGKVNLDPWGYPCGVAQCNYKVTEEGVSKS